MIRGAAGLGLAFVLGWGVWFGVTWAGYGRPQLPEPADPELGRFMPVAELAERHEIRVAAPAAVTYQAARGLDLQRAWVVRAIFAGRELLFLERPRELPARRPFVDEVVALGWGVLADVPGRELVFGAVVQPWQGDVRFRALSPGDFATFDSAGYAKIAWTLAVDSLGPRESRFRTETRVVTTDPTARARFRRYWALFSPGILLIRHAAVRLVRDDAERRWRTSVAP